MELLTKQKNVKAVGVEIDEKAVHDTVEKGLSVFHGDIDSGLSDYRDKSFDYVILNQSIQQVSHVEKVLEDALRVGKKVIIGVPNFAYYKSRFQLGVLGRTPITSNLPYQWYETPNVRSLTLSDFTGLCKKHGVKVLKKIFIGENKRVPFLPNLFAETGIFLISR